jgi:HPt (histidine-containing phosphotransfer) domain-containing protein
MQIKQPVKSYSEEDNMDFKVLADRLGLEVDEYKELIALFIETGRNDLKVLEDALRNNDAPMVVERSHSLKGAAGNLGLTEIYENAKEIENRSRDNNFEGIENYMKMIKEYFKDIVAAYES